MIGVSASASAFVYYRKGFLIPELAAVLIAGVFLGSFAGMRVLYRAGAGWLQALFACLALLAAFRMFFAAVL